MHHDIIMELILLVSTTLYCCAVIIVLIKISAKQVIVGWEKKPFISIIIAARNEEMRIKSTLESLSQLNYNTEKYEVIIVDDASTDQTVALIKEYADNRANWKLLRILKKNDTLKGKKAALKKAILEARGDIILTTDADCVVPKEWCEEMAAVFDDETIMVLGHALLFQKKGWLNKWLRFDNLFSGILMAATTMLGFPMTSVGRNMAYRREAYLKSGGFDQLSGHKSGDDVHLTELFRRKIEGKIKFNLNKKSFTISKPPDSWKEIIHQQIRKNSKILNKSFPSIVLSFFLFFYHALLVVFPFIFPSLTLFWTMLLALKLICEFITLYISAKKFSDISTMWLIPLMQIFYPLYVTVLGIVGIFQSYEWKK